MTEELSPLEAETKAIATEASKEGNFNFLDRLAGRDYPTETVEIYIDESAGYLIQKLEAQAADTKDPDQADIIHAQIEFQREKAKNSRYVVHLEGISVEDYDALVDKSVELFPVQTKETRNPLTYAPESVVIENPEREQYFRTALWAKFIRKVVGPDGGADTNISQEWVAFFMGHVPIAALVKVNEAVEKLRMVTDWMDHVQTDDFLAKS